MDVKVSESHAFDEPSSAVRQVFRRVFRNPLEALVFGLLLLSGAVFVYGTLTRPPFVDEYSFQINVEHFLLYKTWVPSFANYPTLFSYLIFLPIVVVFGVRYVLAGGAWAGLQDPHVVKAFFDAQFGWWLNISRLVTLGFAAALVVLLFRGSWSRYGRQAGLCAAVFLLLDPYGEFFRLAALALPDVLVACLVTASWLCALRFLQTARRKDLIMAGLAAGCAAGMKLNGGLAVFPVLAAPWLMPRSGRERLGDILGAVAAAAGVFFLGSPFYIFAPEVAWAGMRLESLVLVMGDAFGGSGSAGQGYLGLAQELFRHSPVFTLLALAAVIRSFVLRRREDILFHALLIPSLVILGGLERQLLSYLLFLYPLVMMQTADGLMALRGRCSAAWARRAWRIGLAVLMIALAVPAGARLYRHVLPDNRTLARAWMARHLPEGSRILLDWAYGPLSEEEWKAQVRVDQPLSPETAAAIRDILPQARRSYQVHWIAEDYDLTSPESRAAEFLITSDWCYRRYLEAPERPQGARQRYAPMYDFYHRLFSGQTGYQIWKTFNTPVGPDVRIFKYMGSDPGKALQDEELSHN